MKLLAKTADGGATFWCPGCKDMHQIGPQWEIDFGSNTISPSILVTSGHFVPGFKAGSACWCTYEREDGDTSGFKCYRCHSFIRAGQIQFLDDCSHSLAGQTVALQDPEAHK